MSIVYFISAHGHEGPLKIGRKSGSVSKRLKFLQTGNPNRLKVIEELVFDDPQAAIIFEWEIHNKLKARRLVGEWFAVNYDQALQAASDTAHEQNYVAITSYPRE